MGWDQCRKDRVCDQLIGGGESPGCFLHMRLIKLLLLLPLGACRLSENDTPFGEAAPGQSASITATSTQVAGGNGQIVVTTFDSSAGTWEQRQCRFRATEGPCTPGNPVTGGVDRRWLEEVFRKATSGEGRSLRSSYDFEGGIRPPDVQHYKLVVVTAQRRWSVEWDMRAPVPQLLGQLSCYVELARSALIVCNA